MNKALKMKLLQSKQGYYQKVKNLFGSSIIGYWPLWETAGTIAYDISGNGRNGTYTGVTLNQTGIGDGHGAAQFPGAGAGVALYSTSLRDAFNVNEGTLNAWFLMHPDAWGDSTIRYALRLAADAQNGILIWKSGTEPGILNFDYLAANTLSRQSSAVPDFAVTPVMLTLVWSNSGDYVRAYLQGKQVGADVTGLGDWTGVLASTRTFLGVDYSGSPSVWKGQLAHVAIGNAPLSSANISTLFTSLRYPVRFSCLGDSITSNYDIPAWSYIVADQYKNGAVWLTNHAVGGNRIMGEMDAQVLAAATDSAEIMIVALGTNDDDGGNMTALQAEVEENLAELKASNASARIYYMNVLGRWSDNTGATENDKSHIRAAIAAACTAQGVTCWDTYTDPWIVAGDTSDGTHPTAAGAQKIATQVLARLP